MRNLWAVAVVLSFSFVLTNALECLFCKSAVIDSECRLGQRRFKPKLSDCYAPNARCYALARVSINGTAVFKRGCTVDEDYCDRQSDVEFCQTCGAKFCNYWVMDLGSDADAFLREEENSTLKTTTRRTVVRVEKLKKKRTYGNTGKEAAKLSSGVKEQGDYAEGF